MSNFIWTTTTRVLATALEGAAKTKPAEPLSALGWIFLLTSTISMTVLVLWCFARVLSHHAAESKSA